MVKVFPRFLVARPGRVLHSGENHPFVPARRAFLRPDVPVAMVRGRGGARFLKPKVLIGSVIDDEIDDDLHPAPVRLVHELDEIPIRAVARVDAVVVGNIVAVVAIGRGIKGREPDRFHADRVEIIEPAHESFEIADTVAVRVHERLDVEAVNDGVLIPKVFDHCGRPFALRNARARGSIEGWRRLVRSLCDLRVSDDPHGSSPPIAGCKLQPGRRRSRHSCHGRPQCSCRDRVSG